MFVFIFLHMFYFKKVGISWSRIYGIAGDLEHSKGRTTDDMVSIISSSSATGRGYGLATVNFGTKYL